MRVVRTVSPRGGGWGVPPRTYDLGLSERYAAGAPQCWVTVERENWPGKHWPPAPGDRIEIVLPRVAAVERPGED